jgi:hypothetical protein
MNTKKITKDGFYRVAYDEGDPDPVVYQFHGMKQQVEAYEWAVKLLHFRESRRKRSVTVTLHYITTESVYVSRENINDDDSDTGSTETQDQTGKGKDQSNLGAPLRWERRT